jgi:hypothetical protein
LFYLSPTSSPRFESHLVCPWCPYIDVVALGSRLPWLQIAPELGLIVGLLYAAAAFAIGYTVSKLRQPI